ncbi:MAG TPA: hypothetical protein VF192_01290 [Longimicrobiales bacterium]
MPLIQETKLGDLFPQAPMLNAARRTVARTGEAITEGAADRSPVADPPAGVAKTAFEGRRGRKAGTLRDSWLTGEVEFDPTGPRGAPVFGIDSYTEDPVAPHVEWPTRPHLIKPSPDRAAASVRTTGKPRRAGTDPQAALMWIGPGGQPRFAREVQHPGTQGVHMMRDSLAEAEVTWQTVGEAEMEVWARETTELWR